jgi:hypothetical protein
MLIYFVASSTQGQLYQQHYQQILQVLEKMGHKILSRYVNDESEKPRATLTPDERKKYYKQFLQWLNKCDLVVAEVSYPSTINIGYEISTALEKSKPVLALYTSGKASPFLDGISSDKFVYEEYTLENLKQTIEHGLKFAEQQSDARFNFFISPKHISFLDFVSRKRKIPKSVYLRELIERDKRKNREYSEE